MPPGYLYVLLNQSYGANVIKIGLTTRTPDVRAREIYTGATGVPLPFDIAVAYSVADCHKAEKIAHARLRVYRLSNRREFFRLTLAVGGSVAHEACKQVNAELGASEPTPFVFPPNRSAAMSTRLPADDHSDESDGQPFVETRIDRLRESPVGSSTLTEEQVDRAHILNGILTRVNPVARDKWLEGFTRDEHPERELRIWENIAKAYLTLEHADDAPDEYRAEAFDLLLNRSWYPTSEVLARVKLKHFSHANAERLLAAYELRPKPIITRK